MSKTSVFTTTDTVLRPTRLFKITRRDGTIYYLTESQEPVVISPNTWVPFSGTLANIRHTLGGGVPSTSLTAAMTSDGPFIPADVHNGKFRDARFEIYLAPRTSPVAGHYFTGWIGRTTFGWPQNISFEIRGALARGKGSVMQHFGPMCRTDLGSVLCKIPIRPDDVARGTAYALGDFVRARPILSTTPDGYGERVFEVTTAGTSHATVQPSYDYTIGNTTTDGTVVFTARNAFLRYARISSIVDDGHGLILNRNPDARATTSAWFAEGYMYFCTGYSATESEPIAAWSLGDLKITLYRPMTGLVAVNDWVELHRGCDFIRATCLNVFANRKNFRGEPHVLGADVASVGTIPNPVGTQNVPVSPPLPELT